MKRALLTGLGTLLFPALALAQTPPAGEQATGAAAALDASLDPDAPPSTVHIRDDAEPKTPLVPSAKDLLGSHVLVGASIGPAWSLGYLGSNLAAVRGLGTGLGFRADAGVGVSRSVVLGVWGSFAQYADGDNCSSCSGRSLGVGPFVRYHLQQGLRFNPWLSLGAGFRQLSFDPGAGARQKLSGVEWLRLELGADYYVFSGFGVAPYGALSATTYTTRPSTAGDASVNTELSAGLRLYLDVPGR